MAYANSSKVVTDQGILRLDEIVDMSGKKWQDIEGYSINGVPVTRGYVSAEVDVARLDLASGLFTYMKADDDVKIFDTSVKDAFRTKKVRELEAGDKLLVKVDNWDTDDYVEIADYELNEHLAYIIGRYLVIGSISGLRFTFTEGHKDPELVENLSIIFGVEFDENDSFESSEFLTFIAKAGLINAKFSVLKEIRMSPKRVILSFLKGVCQGQDTKSFFLTSDTDFMQEMGICYRAVGYDIKIHRPVDDFVPRGTIYFRPADKPYDMPVDALNTLQELCGKDIIYDTVADVNIVRMKSVGLEVDSGYTIDSLVNSGV